MRIVFFGIDSVYSILPLLALREDFKIEAVFTSGVSRPDLKSKLISGIRNLRGSKYKRFSLEKTCTTYGIPLFHFPTVNSKEAINSLKELNPDVICMSGFNEKLGKEVIAIPSEGVFNAHSSLLPFNRGANPFFWMVRNNEFHTGCTIHRVNENLDDGAIVAQSEVQIYEGINLHIYNTLVAAAAARLFPEVLHKLETGSLAELPNIAAKDQYCRNPNEKDLIIDNSFTVKQALWMYNSLSDSHIVSVIDNGVVKTCSATGSSPFEGSSAYELSDGVIYIVTAP